MSRPTAYATGIEAVKQGPHEVGGQHRLTAPAAPVDPNADVKGEQEVRHEVGRRQGAHLSRRRVEHEHRGERQRDQ